MFVQMQTGQPKVASEFQQAIANAIAE
jgi:hypothetical protein